MIKLNTYLFLIVLILFSGCQPKINLDQLNQEHSNSKMVGEMFSALTDAVVYDIFSPPAASRVYAYVSLSTYESIEIYNDDLIELSGRLNISNSKKISVPEKVFKPLVALSAFNKAAKHFVFSEDKIDVYYQKKYKEFSELSIPKTIWEASEAYGNSVADLIIEYSNSDGYAETRTKKYKVRNEPGDWLPTPPDYMDAIEPNWNQLRPFIIDSATQFIPVKPTDFDVEKNSLFYRDSKSL